MGPRSLRLWGLGEGERGVSGGRGPSDDHPLGAKVRQTTTRRAAPVCLTYSAQFAAGDGHRRAPASTGRRGQLAQAPRPSGGASLALPGVALGGLPGIARALAVLQLGGMSSRALRPGQGPSAAGHLVIIGHAMGNDSKIHSSAWPTDAHVCLDIYLISQLHQIDHCGF